MKETHTLFTRCVSAGICVFALAVMVVFAWADKKAQEGKLGHILRERSAKAAQMLEEDVAVESCGISGQGFFPYLYERLQEICDGNPGVQVACYVDGETTAEGLARVEIGKPDAGGMHYLYLKQENIVYEICGDMPGEKWRRYLSMVFLEEGLWDRDKEITGVIVGSGNFDLVYNEGAEGLITMAVYSFGSYEADPESYEASTDDFVHVKKSLRDGYEQVEETTVHLLEELPGDGDEELLAYFLERYPHMERCRIYSTRVNYCPMRGYYCVVEEKEVTHGILCRKGKVYEISSTERNGGKVTMPYAVYNDVCYAGGPDSVWEKKKNGSSVWRNAKEGIYGFCENIGEGRKLLIQFIPVQSAPAGKQESGGEDGLLAYDVKIFWEGEAQPFQEFLAGVARQAEYSVWEDVIHFEDYNGDGYLDLSYKGSWNGLEAGSKVGFVHCLWSQSQQKFMPGPKGVVYSSYFSDKDKRRIRVDGGSDGYHEYSNYTYQWYDETEQEMIKSFFYSWTEDDNMLVRIVSLHDGMEQVLMDCSYDLDQYWYDADRYYFGGVFWDFYADDLVWEKTLQVGTAGEQYNLYYAQEIQYEGYDKERLEGYEGHLWVTDKDTRLVKRLCWQSEAPYTGIVWKEEEEAPGEAALFIRYGDGSEKAYTLSEILADPVTAVYEKGKQIDYTIKEYSIDAGRYDEQTDAVYKDAYYRAVSSQVPVRDLEGREVYLKGYWFYQGDAAMEMSDGEFLENIIRETYFYYMDFDGDGLPELVMDIMGDGLHILKYLPEEDVVEIFFGWERMPYFNLLGAGQLYYHNAMRANKDLWEYDLVDGDGEVQLVVYLRENYEYKEQDDEWETVYWVYLDEELGLVRVPGEIYEEITGGFFDAVDRAPAAMTFEEVFGSGSYFSHPR